MAQDILDIDEAALTQHLRALDGQDLDQTYRQAWNFLYGDGHFGEREKLDDEQMLQVESYAMKVMDVAPGVYEEKGRPLPAMNAEAGAPAAVM
ncbi:MAG: hypothetical protein H6856_07940 [Rhodospirillales bacterium]|nr:hypothetical protein [Rhodospirillales bacterium]